MWRATIPFFSLLVFLFSGIFLQNASAQESFCPANAQVLDYSLSGQHVIVHTTDGSYERIAPHFYLKQSRFNSIFSTHIARNEEYQVLNGSFIVHTLPRIAKKFPGVSVRHISKNAVGSYAGVWVNGSQLNQFQYSSGAIRTYEDTTYVCFDGLGVIVQNELQQAYFGHTSATFLYHQKDLSPISDIYVDKGQWIALCRQGVYSINSKTQKVDTLYSLKEPNTDNHSRFARLNSTSIIGFIHNIVFEINPKVNSFTVLHRSPKPIVSLCDSHRLYITTKDSIYPLVRTPDVTTIHGTYHGILPISNGFFLYNNTGLFIKIGKDPEIHPIFFTETNRHAIYHQEDSLFVGTTNGIWSIAIPNNLSSLISSPEPPSPFSFIQRTLVWVGLLSFSLILFFTFRHVKKKNAPVIEASREVIEAYIDSNIAGITLAQICARFHLSQSRLYEIFGSDRPGEVIREKRVQIVRELVSKDMDLKSISIASGFSADYLKKTVIPNL